MIPRFGFCTPTLLEGDWKRHSADGKTLDDDGLLTLLGHAKDDYDESHVRASVLYKDCEKTAESSLKALGTGFEHVKYVISAFGTIPLKMQAQEMPRYFV